MQRPKRNRSKLSLKTKPASEFASHAQRTRKQRRRAAACGVHYADGPMFQGIEQSCTVSDSFSQDRQRHR